MSVRSLRSSLSYIMSTGEPFKVRPATLTRQPEHYNTLLLKDAGLSGMSSGETEVRPRCAIAVNIVRRRAVLNVFDRLAPGLSGFKNRYARYNRSSHE